MQGMQALCFTHFQGRLFCSCSSLQSACTPTYLLPGMIFNAIYHSLFSLNLQLLQFSACHSHQQAWPVPTITHSMIQAYAQRTTMTHNAPARNFMSFHPPERVPCASARSPHDQSSTLMASAAADQSSTLASSVYIDHLFTWSLTALDQSSY